MISDAEGQKGRRAAPVARGPGLARPGGQRALRAGVGLRLPSGRWASLPGRPVAARRNPGSAGVLHCVAARWVRPSFFDGPVGPLLPPTRPTGAGLWRFRQE